MMAGFEGPQDAIRAFVEMIEELSRFNRTVSRPLGLKVGAHRGRTIAVTLNDRIDSLGQDVNIAARVQGLADVNEACISATVMEALGAGDIVKSHSVSRNYENLKGIGQQMEAHRVVITPTQT
jgi:class 3 adenylate cyclase